MSDELSEVVLDQKVVNTVVGKVFYDDNLVNALRAAQEFAGPDGYVASAPEIMHARVISSSDDIWGKFFSAMSEEIVGTTKQGSEVLVECHGGGIFNSPKRIQRAIKEGLINGAGKVSQKEFNNLLQGKKSENEIPIYSYTEFLQQTKLPRNYAIIIDLDKVKNLDSEYQNIENLYENPLMIARAGGQEQAKNYLKKAQQVYQNDELGLWHSLKNVDTSKTSGRLLFVGYDFNFNINDNNFYYSARFVGVQTSAEGTTRKIVVPTLEQVLAITNKFTAEVNQAELKTALTELYGPN